jgi:hypothetical protein
MESGFSIVEKICTQVKRWQSRDAGTDFPYKHMPALIAALQSAYKVQVDQAASSAA